MDIFINTDDPRKVNPRYIKQLLKEFNLTWADLHRACNYSARGNALYNACRQPEKYLTPLMQKKIIAGVAKLKKERGRVHHVESTVRFIPKNYRITHAFVICKGHKEYCTYVDKNGFCGDECKQLFNARAKNRRGK